MLLNLFGLNDARIAGGKEKILVHYRLKIDKRCHQDKQHDRDSEHFPMRAERDQFIANRALHRFSIEFSHNCISDRHRAPCNIAK